MVTISFGRGRKKKVEPVVEPFVKPVSRKLDVGVGGGDRVVLSADYDKGVVSSPSVDNSSFSDQANIIPPIPPTPTPPPELKNPVFDEIEYFKRVYSGVFGFDSVVPSSRDVLMLNLLFAIYSELVNIRKRLEDSE